MNSKITQTAGLGAAALAAVLLAGTALADGMPKRGSIKAPEPEQRRCTLSANVGITTDYVFRGISQTAEGPAIQGGFDATCGLFYAGVWGSNLDFGGSGGQDVANLEIDWYAGVKPKTGPITWDLGVIYYSYPNALGSVADLNYFEVKVGGSAEIWKDGTLGVTVFYSPEYTGESGHVWTIETAFAQALPKVGMFSPTFSALVGVQRGNNSNNYGLITNGDDGYVYWNAGVTLGFHEKWSLDLRYWDTNISNSGDFCDGGNNGLLQCDARFVATLKFTY
jgi:uncharacterized protein (TIGR02001 family)